MNIKIITEYPLWFLLFCVILGAGITVLLYYRNKRYRFPRLLERILAVIRFLMVTLLSFLLLSPLIKTSVRSVEKPVIVFAQDNSNSIVINKDSAYYHSLYPKDLDQFINALKEDYNVKEFSFGDKVRDTLKVNFKDKTTDISAVLDELKVRYSNRNVGAVILATDGLYNKGENPLYSLSQVAYPVYTVALGDTSVYRDVLVSKISTNTTAFLGNKFPVEIDVKAYKCKGESLVLTVSKNKEVLYKETIPALSDAMVHTVYLSLEAKTAGVQRYSVTLNPVGREVTLVNNYKDFFIDVLDQRHSVLILANSPNPDVAAIKEAFEKSDNYTVDSYLAGDFTKTIKGYDLIVLHQLPSVTNKISQLLADAAKSETPLLFVLGSQTNFNAFNSLNTGMTVSASKSMQNEALAVINSNFPLFTVDDETRLFADDLPPLNAAFGTYKVTNSANILFYQKIGSVATKQPLILFNQQGNTRTCVIAGDGIWRWKLTDFMKHQNHDIFNGLLGKFVQYLAASGDKSFFRVKGENNYYENEAVEFTAELYNDSYELVNTPDVNFSVYDSSNKKYDLVFSKTTDAYRLNAGIFPVGTYRYEAKTSLGNKTYTKSGFFNVIAVNLESMATAADHKMLYNIAKQHNAQMFYPKQFNELLKAIKDRDDIKPVSYTQKRLNDVVNIFWICLILILLLSSEWFLRKWSGNY